MSSQDRDQRWLRNSELAARLGVTVMTIWRWQKDAALKFPQPSLINGKPYTDIDEVNRWMRSRVVSRLAKETAA
jgi:predicted DNA-binding transcriptional regulator AlpA